MYEVCGHYVSTDQEQFRPLILLALGQDNQLLLLQLEILEPSP